MRRAQPSRSARAFAPGHITGVFAPALEAHDPRARGSVGAGLVLELGVYARATFTPDRPRRLLLTSDVRHPLPISLDVAHRFFAGGDGRLEVELRHELPIGQGFGMSSAGALATALAVAAVLGAPTERVVRTAHVADLFGGGGLGGVSAILGGGLELRRTPGIPPWGEIRHRQFPAPIFLTVVGPPIPSPTLLENPRFLKRVRRTAGRGIRRLARQFSPSAFLAESARFGDRLGLATPAVRDALRRLRSPGVAASQTMFGQAVWAVASSVRARRRLMDALEASGVSSVEVHAASVRGVPWVRVERRSARRGRRRSRAR